MVTPDWILDSIDAGQKQDEALYHPSCLRLKGSHHHHARTTSLSSPTLQRCNGDSNTAAATGEEERDREEEKNETQTDTSGDCARLPQNKAILSSETVERGGGGTQTKQLIVFALWYCANSIL